MNYPNLQDIKSALTSKYITRDARRDFEKELDKAEKNKEIKERK